MFSIFKAAVSFLTALPVPSSHISQDDLGKSVAFFPLVGLLLGILWSSLALFLLHYNMPESVASVLLVLTMAVLTRGMHLDGLADTADGLAALHGKNVKAALNAMKDSSIGAIGALTLFLTLALKIACIHSLLLEFNDIVVLLMLLPVIVMGNLVIVMYKYPYLRKEGLGTAFNQNTILYSCASTIIAASIIICTLALFVNSIYPLLFAIIASLGASWVCTHFINSHIGGLTGDIYGAIVEFSSTSLLLATVIANTL